MIRNYLKLLCCFFAVILSFESSAQSIVIGATKYQLKNSETIVGKAFYDFMYLKDTTQPDNLYTEKLELSFGKKAALFESYSAKENDSLMQAQISEQVKRAPDPNHLALTLQASANASKDIFYTSISGSPKIFNLKTLASALFYITDAQPKIDWKILDSTKSIQENICQKAIGESHGRTYTAWFCADIPYSFGPRKLNGLPGLILEAYDEKREVVYTFDRIEKAGNRQIGIPDMAIPATDEQYNKAFEAYRKNPSAFRSEYKSGGTPISTAFDGIDPSKIASLSIIKGSPNQPNKHLTENNPIDLK
jgi:GLPGLI family protein